MPIRRSDTMRAVDAVMPLVDQFNLLDEGDKLTFLDLVDPLPEGHNHKSKKKASKKSSKSSSSKSLRATGIEQQLNKRQEQREPMVTTKDDNYDPEAERCTFPRDDGKLCFLLPDHNVHHMKSAVGFHSFQSSSDASSADSQSPANGGATSGTQSSEASAASAGAATGGSNE